MEKKTKQATGHLQSVQVMVLLMLVKGTQRDPASNTTRIEDGAHWATQGPRSLSGALRRGWEAWREDPDRGTKSPGGPLHGGFPTGAVKVGSEGKAGGGLESPVCSQAVPPCRILPCSTERDIMKSLRPASLNQLLPRVFEVTGQQSSCRPVQPLAETQPRDPPDTLRWHVPSRRGRSTPRERHRRGCHDLPATTSQAGKEEGVLRAALARKRRGAGVGAALSLADAAMMVSRD